MYSTTGIKRLLLLFWALWLSVVACTNILNGLQALGIVPESFRFVSGNWAWINATLDRLAAPRGLQAFLFASVVIWEAVAAALFWRAVFTFGDRPINQERETLFACFVNLALWSAFLVLDEIFLAYQPEAVHRSIFVMQIATILVLCLIPAMKDGGCSH